MKYSISVFFALMCFFICSCKDGKFQSKDISVLALRVSDTLYIKIANKSNSIIYIPNAYTPAFNVDSDTIHLEVWDKPRFNLDYYFLYKKAIQNEVYTTKKIPGETPDSIIKIFNPEIYYNQHLVRPFIAIKPNSIYTQSIIFDVPQNANFAQIVCYKMSFSNWMGRDSLNYKSEDFVKFDSINAQCLITLIYNGHLFR